jgi:hypothetical protein
MYMKLVGTVASAVVALSAAQATAATITIFVDSFSTDQAVSDVPGLGQVNSSTVISGGGDIIGGTRTMTAELASTDTGSAVNATSLTVSGGGLSFSNDDGAKGKGSLFYNGGGAGLGNLAIGINPFFFFDVSRFDNDANLVFAANLTDTSGSTITFSENIEFGFDPQLFFTDFTGFDTFDFTDVASLEFIVDSSDTVISVDGRIEAITLNATPIPLPASALLLLGGVGGLSLLRRRRSKS